MYRLYVIFIVFFIMVGIYPINYNHYQIFYIFHTNTTILFIFYHIFSPKMVSSKQKRSDFSKCYHHSISQNKINQYYNPKLNIHSRITKIKALLYIILYRTIYLQHHLDREQYICVRLIFHLLPQHKYQHPDKLYEPLQFPLEQQQD
ncbi:hypothetical protein SAMN02910278_00348 [Peptostreptococcus sp. D1]|nr:hypothetical protein SAMN02910278_00348 [Peptostreptococcus sp. D1]